MSTKPATKPTKAAPLSVVVENGRLIINAPLETPRASKSEKTMVVASTHGNIDTGAELDGKPLIIGLNVYYRA